MKLVPAKCPSCWADIEVNKDLEKTICQYCGTTVLIDDAVQKYKLEISNSFLIFKCYNKKEVRHIMKKIKDIIIIPILILVIVLLYLLIVNNYGNKYPSNLIIGKFEYVPSMETNSVEGTYYYSDDYFIESGKNQNSHLRTMIMNIVLSGTMALDKENNTYNIKKLLNDIGYQDISVYDYDTNSKDTIGMVIANKKIKDYNVIIISLRGDNYGLEWSNNFEASKSGSIKGFDYASKKVVKIVKEYVKNKNLTSNNKIVVSGYSRAGAISNLVGIYLNEHLSEFYLNSDDNIYVYTFEAPISSSNKTIYKNIHNVVNKNDLITYVYPSKWGLQNNGIEEDITSGDMYIDVYNINYGNIISGNEIFEKNSKNVKLNEFLKDFFDWLAKNSLSRNTYDDTFGKYLPNVVKTMYGKTDKEKTAILNYFKNDFVKELKSNSSELYLMLLAFISKDNLSNKQLNEYSNYIKKCFDSSRNRNVPLSNDEFNMFKDFFSDYNVLKLLKDFISSSFNEEPKAYHLSTMTKNAELIVKQHYNSINYDLVKKYDSYYK